MSCPRFPDFPAHFPGDIAAAEALVRRLELKLRAPDAIHIALALRARARLATFDERLADAARGAGVGVEGWGRG